MSVAAVSGGESERMKRRPSKRSSEVTRSSPGAAVARTSRSVGLWECGPLPGP